MLNKKIESVTVEGNVICLASNPSLDAIRPNNYTT